eukprot:XP_019926915.1 PREDICTED: uncharacterized protein LOC109619977 isoform X1 [Crassostrea gigas]
MSETEENIDVANVSNNAIPNPLPGKSIGSCSLNKGSIQGLENHSQNKENRHIHVRVMNARHEVSQRNSIRAEKSITKSSEASISSRIVTKDHSVSTIDLVKSLLGECELVQQLKKFKTLHLNHPSDKTFKNSYEAALAKVQTAISKLQREAKGDPKMHEKRKLAEKLMVHWGIYYF